MKTSITQNKFIYITFWVIIWHLLSVIVSQDILLVSPVTVFMRLLEMICEADFYWSIWNTFSRIFVGFAFSAFVGTLLAILSKKNQIIYNLCAPPMNVIKVTPVASFIILALFWFQTKDLPAFISFIMVLPIFYSNIYEGIDTVDNKMLEMAKVYNLSKVKKIIYIYIPEMMPIIFSSLILGLSIGWKSGIAAEVIAISSNTIGGQIQRAKVILETGDVFAWTITTIFISIGLEKIFIKLLDKVQRIILKKGMK
ncbi:MAG: ABC transporter permease subunit [Clostridia bacterium]